MKRRNFLGLASAIGMSAFAPNLFAKERIDIYGAPALPSVIMGVAALNGNATSEFDINFRTWSSPDQLRAGIANGSMKATMAPSNVGANLYNQGLNFKMLNILTFGSNTIMTKDISVKSLFDLIGKKLVMPFRSDMPDIIFQATLKRLGIDANAINITYVSTLPEALGLFLQKDYDAVMLLEPLASACELRAKKMGVAIYRTINIQQEFGKAYGRSPIVPQAGIIVEAQFYEQNLKFFDLYTNDLKEALEFIKNNPQSAAEIGSNYLSAPIPALANSFKNANLVVTPANELKDEFLSFFEIIYQFNPKLLGGKIPDDGLFL